MDGDKANFESVSGLKVLVTGGAGFIGSALVRKMQELGAARVAVVDNLARGLKENLPADFDFDKDFFEYDLTDYSKCKEVFTTDFDLVYHLADVVGGIAYMFANEGFAYRQNVLINSNVLTACIENNLKNYIYVGTACSFPKHLQMDKSKIVAIPIDKTYPAEPESAYGWSKLMGEYEAELALKEKKINVGMLRFHNVYGEGQGCNPKDSQVLPALCRKAIECQSGGQLEVWGTGSQYRDFIHLDDIIAALVLVPLKGMNKPVVQIGSGYATTIRQAAELISKIAGKPEYGSKTVNLFFDTSKPQGDFGRISINDGAKAQLGWEPKVSIQQGLDRLYGWMHKNISELGISG